MSEHQQDASISGVLKKVLTIVFKEHPLTANQILVLSAELQRIGVHRLVEEHLERYGRRQGASSGTPPARIDSD